MVGLERRPLAVVGRRETVEAVIEEAVASLERLAARQPGIGCHRAVPSVLVC